MNGDQQLDRQQLEVATSRTLPTSAALDSETSALRDGFIAMGKAVESAAADYDEAAFVARVQAACFQEDALVAPATRTTPTWTLLLSGVLAASALVAVVRIVANWQSAAAVVVAPTAPTQNNDSQPEPSPKALVDDGTPGSIGTASSIAWDDPLDQEIAAAQSNLADLSGPLTGIDGHLSNMNQSLEALSDDLSGESL